MLAKETILEKRYRILRLLSEGGMGAVYLAEDLNLRGKWVALKENKGGSAHQFEAEALLLADLRHPNLPRVTDHFTEPGLGQYLVMDYIEGRELTDVVQSKGALDEQKALTWFYQISDAVKYLHAHDILHRDVKPRNIIITPDDKAVLVDFGIAKVNASGQNTSTSLRAGSPGFAAPEQYVGGTTVRTDVYALGAVLYFMLTGVFPPESPQRSAGTALIPPRKIRSSISGTTERAVVKALNLDTSQRYASVEQMEQGLRGRTGPITPPLPTPRPSSRLNPILILGAIVLLGLVAFGIFYVLTQSNLIAGASGVTATRTTAPTQVNTNTRILPTKTVPSITPKSLPALLPTTTLIPTSAVVPTLTLVPTSTVTSTRRPRTATPTETPTIESISPSITPTQHERNPQPTNQPQATEKPQPTAKPTKKTCPPGKKTC